MRGTVRAVGALFAGLLLSACPEGDGAIFLTVDATSGTTLTAIDSLRMTITNGGQTTAPIAIVPAGAPITLPPARTIPLRFERERSGATMITVVALRGAEELAMGTTTVQLRPGAITDASIALVGSSNNDLGIDMVAPPPDLVAADLVGADLSMVPDLVVPDLTPPADLFGCTVAPAKPGGTVYYVSPAGQGGNDGATPTTPILPAQIANLIENAASTPITFLLDEGNYTGIAIDASASVTLMGGYYRDFSCRDAATHPTKIQSTAVGVAGIAITSATATLDGLTVYGLSDTVATNHAIGVRVATGKVTIRNCELRSHAPLAVVPAGARGLVIIDSTADVFDTAIQVPDATDTLQAVEICNTTNVASLSTHAWFVRSQIVATGGNTVGEPYGIAAMGCRGVDLKIDHSVVRVDNTGGVGHVVLVSSETDGMAVTIDNAALIASQLHQAVLHTKGAAMKTVVVRASTVNSAFSSGIAMMLDINTTLQLTDSIVKAGEAPFYFPPSITMSARNLFFGLMQNRIYVTGASPMLSDYQASFESSAMPVDQSSFGDPMLEADLFHLTGASPALGKASCPFPTDIDGAARPATACDIGADEFSP